MPVPEDIGLNHENSAHHAAVKGHLGQGNWDIKTVLLNYHELNTVVPGGLNHGIAILRVKRHRFFNKDISLYSCCLNSHWCMKTMWRADVYNIAGYLIQHIVVICIPRYTWVYFCKLPADILIDIAKSCNIGPRFFIDNSKMAFANVAATNDREINFV